MTIRTIDVSIIREHIENLCIISNKILPKDVENKLTSAKQLEDNPLAYDILCDLENNLNLAKTLNVPICQDTGMAVVFLDIGQDVHFVGGDLTTAINEGVANGYKNGFLRMSIVLDPLRRINTNNNTPAVIHINIVPGDKVNITFMPKGFGSENMSQIKMFEPSTTKEDIIDFVVSVVATAGANPCPPVVVGVGIGGNFESCAKLSKLALCDNLTYPHKDKFYSEMEQTILNKLNMLNIGPQGFCGKTTALGVKIRVMGTHIAGLPVSVNIGCHATRHMVVEI